MESLRLDDNKLLYYLWNEVSPEEKARIELLKVLYEVEQLPIIEPAKWDN